MNKELEETKQILENIKDSIDCDCKENMEFRQALDTTINYIENSISKETIKKHLEKDKVNYIDVIHADNKVEVIQKYISYLEKELLKEK